MTYKQGKALFIGLVVAGLANGLVFIVLMITNLDLFGTEELRDPEHRHGKFFYTSLVATVITLALAFLMHMKQRKYAAIGIVIPGCVGLFLLLRLGFVFFNKSNYYQLFNKHAWDESEIKPLKMARGLVKSRALLGLNKNEVAMLLGKGREIEEQEMIQYGIRDHWYCILTLSFADGRVDHADIWVDD